MQNSQTEPGMNTLNKQQNQKAKNKLHSTFAFGKNLILHKEAITQLVLSKLKLETETSRVKQITQSVQTQTNYANMISEQLYLVELNLRNESNLQKINQIDVCEIMHAVVINKEQINNLNVLTQIPNVCCAVQANKTLLETLIHNAISKNVSQNISQNIQQNKNENDEKCGSQKQQVNNIYKMKLTQKNVFAHALYSSKFEKLTLNQPNQCTKPVQQLETMLSRVFLNAALRKVVEHQPDCMLLVVSRYQQIKKQMEVNGVNCFLNQFGLWNQQQSLKIVNFFVNCVTYFKGGAISELEDWNAFSAFQRHHKFSYKHIKNTEMSREDFINLLINNDDISLFSLSLTENAGIQHILNFISLLLLSGTKLMALADDFFTLEEVNLKNSITLDGNEPNYLLKPVFVSIIHKDASGEVGYEELGQHFYTNNFQMKNTKPIQCTKFVLTEFAISNNTSEAFRNANLMLYTPNTKQDIIAVNNYANCKPAKFVQKVMQNQFNKAYLENELLKRCEFYREIILQGGLVRQLIAERDDFGKFGFMKKQGKGNIGNSKVGQQNQHRSKEESEAEIEIICGNYFEYIYGQQRFPNNISNDFQQLIKVNNENIDKILKIFRVLPSKKPQSEFWDDINDNFQQIYEIVGGEDGIKQLILSDETSFQLIEKVESSLKCTQQEASVALQLMQCNIVPIVYDYQQNENYVSKSFPKKQRFLVSRPGLMQYGKLIEKMCVVGVNEKEFELYQLKKQQKEQEKKQQREFIEQQKQMQAEEKRQPINYQNCQKEELNQQKSNAMDNNVTVTIDDKTVYKDERQQTQEIFSEQKQNQQIENQNDVKVEIHNNIIDITIPENPSKNNANHQVEHISEESDEESVISIEKLINNDINNDEKLDEIPEFLKCQRNKVKSINDLVDYEAQFSLKNFKKRVKQVAYNQQVGDDIYADLSALNNLISHQDLVEVFNTHRKMNINISIFRGLTRRQILKKFFTDEMLELVIERVGFKCKNTKLHEKHVFQLFFHISDMQGMTTPLMNHLHPFENHLKQQEIIEIQQTQNVQQQLNITLYQKIINKHQYKNQQTNLNRITKVSDLQDFSGENKMHLQIVFERLLGMNMKTISNIQSCLRELSSCIDMQTVLNIINMHYNCQVEECMFIALTRRQIIKKYLNYDMMQLLLQPINLQSQQTELTNSELLIVLIYLDEISNAVGGQFSTCMNQLEKELIQAEHQFEMNCVQQQKQISQTNKQEQQKAKQTKIEDLVEIGELQDIEHTNYQQISQIIQKLPKQNLNVKEATDFIKNLKQIQILLSVESMIYVFSKYKNIEINENFFVGTPKRQVVRKYFTIQMMEDLVLQCNFNINNQYLSAIEFLQIYVFLGEVAQQTAGNLNKNLKKFEEELRKAEEQEKCVIQVEGEQ